ncbi:phage tail protein [Oxalobacter paraformigenes]|uniref:Phage tail collar domain-containing protein n=1 Tax=Oxalobacter paraformigenes TaxID=556268 RepID=C3X192_9BURK|nr:phage tail protein [Oxalobacter paraformigenes]EEO26978.1 hypothetical protein OFAG_00131 [Oxalobacter paraformigenes]
MDRAFLADVSEIPPSPPETPLIGYPRNGDPASGVRATKPGAWWYHMIEEEILNVIRDAGLTPDPKKVDQLVEAINKRSGVPIGTVEYFAMATPPAGYLKADGAAVGRATYPDLFAAIGTTFGAGDGETTFNLPDMIGQFAEGSATPGAVKEAGLPNIIGSISNVASGGANASSASGALSIAARSNNNMTPGSSAYGHTFALAINASDFNPIYGKSNTVQPPALTLLPCIKAFDAAVNPGLIDITELANEMAGKVDKVINGKRIAYVIDSYRNGTNWWRRWSDGWVEQGGKASIPGSGGADIVLLLPFLNADYCVTVINIDFLISVVPGLNGRKITGFNLDYASPDVVGDVLWSACGQGASS